MVVCGVPSRAMFYFAVPLHGQTSKTNNDMLFGLNTFVDKLKNSVSSYQNVCDCSRKKRKVLSWTVQYMYKEE